MPRSARRIPLPRMAGEGRPAGSVTFGRMTACVRQKGALQDYIRTILKYENFAGSACWSFLPKPIQQLHRAFVKDLIGGYASSSSKANDSQWQEASSKVTEELLDGFLNCGPGTITQRGGIFTPCVSSKGAVEDYRDVIVKYGGVPGLLSREFSGPNCWRTLPEGLKAIHLAFVREIESLPEYRAYIATPVFGGGTSNKTGGYAHNIFAPRWNACTCPHNLRLYTR